MVFHTSLFSCKYTYSQKAKVEIPGTEVIKFKSLINKQDYVLNVYLPVSYTDPTKKFPVLYVLDGQWSFPYIAGVQGIAEGLFYDGLAPEMIVVGITWNGDYDANRQRDFTPVQTNEFLNSGGAPRFLTVMRNEIVTKIDSGYRTDKVNNTLTGGSLGGLFTLYEIFKNLNFLTDISPGDLVVMTRFYNWQNRFLKKIMSLMRKCFFALMSMKMN